MDTYIKTPLIYTTYPKLWCTAIVNVQHSIDATAKPSLLYNLSILSYTQYTNEYDEKCFFMNKTM